MKEKSFRLMALISVCVYTVAASCPQGQYGTDCSHNCHCQSGSCNATTGHCFSRYLQCAFYKFGVCRYPCQGGWIGHSCNLENYAYKQPIAAPQSDRYYDLESAVDRQFNSYNNRARLPFNSGVREEQWIEIHINRTVAVEFVLLYSTKYSAGELDYFEVAVGNQSRTFTRQILCERKSFNYTGWVGFTCPRPISGEFISLAHSRVRTNIYHNYWYIEELLILPAKAYRFTSVLEVKGLKAEVSAVYNDFRIEVSWLPTTNSFNDTIIYDVQIYYNVLSCPSEVENAGKIPWVPLPDTNTQIIETHYNFLYPYFHTRYRIDVKPFVLLLAEGLPVSTVFIDSAKARASKASLAPAELSASEITSRSVLIEWTAPACDKWHAPFVSYTLTYGSTRLEIYNASAISYKITNLMPATNYTILLSFSTDLETSFDASVTVITSNESPGDEHPTETPAPDTSKRPAPATTATQKATTVYQTTSSVKSTPVASTSTTVKATAQPPVSSATTALPDMSSTDKVTALPQTAEAGQTTSFPPTTSTLKTAAIQTTTSDSVTPQNTLIYVLVGVCGGILLAVIIAVTIVIMKRKTPNSGMTGTQQGRSARDDGRTAADVTSSSARVDHTYEDVINYETCASDGHDHPRAPNRESSASAMYSGPPVYVETGLTSQTQPISETPNQLPGARYVGLARRDNPSPEYSGLNESSFIGATD